MADRRDQIPREDAGGGASGSTGAWTGEHEAAWQTLKASLGSASSGHKGGGNCIEFCPICRGAELLRTGGPPELRGQFTELQREALLTFRALIDFYLERIEAEPSETAKAQQIPID